MTVHATGSCLCRGVRYEITGKLNPVLACHCSMCAKTSGNYAAMSSCSADDLNIVSDQTLNWYPSSDAGHRGFCTRCGGNLFWRRPDDDQIFVTAGTLDKPTGLKIKEHIFVGSKSDYYNIADGLPQKDEW